MKSAWDYPNLLIKSATRLWQDPPPLRQVLLALALCSLFALEIWLLRIDLPEHSKLIKHTGVIVAALLCP